MNVYGWEFTASVKGDPMSNFVFVSELGFVNIYFEHSDGKVSRRGWKAGDIDEALEAARTETNYLERSGLWKMAGGLTEFLASKGDVEHAFTEQPGAGMYVPTACGELVLSFRVTEKVSEALR